MQLLLPVEEEEEEEEEGQSLSAMDDELDGALNIAAGDVASRSNAAESQPAPRLDEELGLGDPSLPRGMRYSC